MYSFVHRNMACAAREAVIVMRGQIYSGIKGRARAPLWQDHTQLSFQLVKKQQNPIAAGNVVAESTIRPMLAALGGSDIHMVLES